jgi:hypothetical protein
MCTDWTFWYIAAQVISSSVVCILASGPPLSGVAGKEATTGQASCAARPPEGVLQQFGWLTPVPHIAMHQHDRSSARVKPSPQF